MTVEQSRAKLADIRPHQTVRVLRGTLAGLVGTVEAIGPASVRVTVDGVLNGEPFAALRWMKADALEVLA